MLAFLTTNSAFISLILAGLVIILAVLVIRQEIRLKKLLKGKNATDLEEVIIDMAQALDQLANQHLENKEKIDWLKASLRQSVRHVRTMRFDPFNSAGGNQSFATAFLNDEGHGVVLSGLYTRGQFNAYAKPVKNRASEHELSDEERAVLEPIQ